MDPLLRAVLLAFVGGALSCGDSGPAQEGSSRKGERSGRAAGRASSSAETGLPPVPAVKARAGGPPNVIFILVDDQRAESTACMPKLKRLLADKGTEFVNAFATTPLCCPSRSSSLTGLYAQHHGVLANGDIEADDEEEAPGVRDFMKNGNEERAIVKPLRAAGYRTGFVGKYLNGYDELLKEQRNYVPPHWDDWYAFPHAEYFDFMLVERPRGAKAKTVCYPSTAARDAKLQKKCKADSDELAPRGESYSTDVLVEKAVRFIDDAAKEGKPFFLYLAPKAPHGPMLSPLRYQPDPDKAEFTAEARARLGACEQFEWQGRPESFLEQDVSDKPAWVQKQKPPPREKLDQQRKQQLVSMLAVEDAIETLQQRLSALGISEQTVIIYMGDNGFAWGDHGYKGKNCAYEECIRVPLVVLDPRHPAAAKKEETFVLNVDVPATIGELAGLSFAHDKPLDGKSFMGLWNGKGGFSRDEVLIECWGNGKRNNPPIVAGVRTNGWKYVEHFEDPQRTKPAAARGGAPVVELYDLAKDPHELLNLLGAKPAEISGKGYDKAQVERVVAEHKARLDRLIGRGK